MEASSSSAVNAKQSLTWDDFDPAIPIGWYWKHVDLNPLNPKTNEDIFPLYVIPITKRTIKIYVSLKEKIFDIKEKIRVELKKDGQYVPNIDDFCIVPQVPLDSQPLDDEKLLGDYPCASDWEFWFSVLIEYYTAPPDPIPIELRKKLMAPSPADARYGGTFDEVE